MISFPGYDDVIREIYYHNQDHVFEYWDELDDREKRSLLEDLSSVDISQLSVLFSTASDESQKKYSYTPAEYMPFPHTEEARARCHEARSRGEQHVRNGKVAAFLVAGGQGTRLGFDGPKGAYPVGPVSGKSLFQIHGEKIRAYSKKYNTVIPWLIMTSVANHDETVEFFTTHKFFGLRKEHVYIFPQNMIPSLDFAGKLILKNRCSLFKNPDGHGGSLTALRTSGMITELERRGIETVSYFQVDNPLVKIIDPVFIGFHVMEESEISSKGMMKTGPKEKVGVFVHRSDGKTGILEYSDMTEEMQNARGPEGNLLYCMGNPAIHLFSLKFIDTITSGGALALPYHVAKKKIEALRSGGYAEIRGYKFEKFVFDAIPIARKTILLETLREEEFAPVKNKSGEDSVETARDLMNRLSFRWLAMQGIPVSEKTKVIEISPLRAVEPEDLSGDVPAREKIYLD